VSFHLPHLQRHLVSLLAASEAPLEIVHFEFGEASNRILAAAAAARLIDDRDRILVISIAHLLEAQLAIWNEAGFDAKIRRAQAPGIERVTLSSLETVRSRDAYWHDVDWDLLVLDDFPPPRPGTGGARTLRGLRRVVPTIWIKDGGAADRYKLAGGLAEGHAETPLEREFDRLRLKSLEPVSLTSASRPRASAFVTGEL
jgi:hypothetical protein